eukprot:10306725-Prorocentrum_lima.AAC.1
MCIRDRYLCLPGHQQIDCTLLRQDHPKLLMIQFLLGSEDDRRELQTTFPNTPHLGGAPLQPVIGSRAPD